MPRAVDAYRLRVDYDPLFNRGPHMFDIPKPNILEAIEKITQQTYDTVSTAIQDLTGLGPDFLRDLFTGSFDIFSEVPDFVKNLDEMFEKTNLGKLWNGLLNVLGGKITDDNTSTIAQFPQLKDINDNLNSRLDKAFKSAETKAEEIDARVKDLFNDDEFVDKYIDSSAAVRKSYNDSFQDFFRLVFKSDSYEDLQKNFADWADGLNDATGKLADFLNEIITGGFGNPFDAAAKILAGLDLAEVANKLAVGAKKDITDLNKSVDDLFAPLNSFLDTIFGTHSFTDGFDALTDFFAGSLSQIVDFFNGIVNIFAPHSRKGKEASSTLNKMHDDTQRFLSFLDPLHIFTPVANPSGHDLGRGVQGSIANGENANNNMNALIAGVSSGAKLEDVIKSIRSGVANAVLPLDQFLKTLYPDGSFLDKTTEGMVDVANTLLGIKRDVDELMGDKKDKNNGSSN